MSVEEFIAQVDVEVQDSQLDELQQKLKTIEKNKIKLNVEVDSKDEVAKLAKSIENGLKNTKVDTSGMVKSLADSFNIDDKSIIRKMKSQVNNMMSNLGSTWNGKNFDLSKASGFYSGMENLGKLVADNAKIIESKMGIYDKFYDYAKNKKLFVSDDLKKALDGDEYKELLKNNVGKIVKDASKGISIDSIWGELSESFPEHFSENITNQADQLRRYFEVLKAAREDITEIIPASEMNTQQLVGISDSAYTEVIEMATQMRTLLEKNILSASESEKNIFDLNVDINTEKIISDIRNALSSATASVDDALNINLKMNDEEIASQIRSAINKLNSGNEPVEIGIQINKESLQTDISMILNELDLPIHFNIDAAELEADIRQAINSITDIEIDLRVNTDNLDVGITDIVTKGTDPLDEVRERAKKNPIEVGYKADNTSISNLVNTADRVFDLFTGTTALDFSGDKIRQAISDLKDLNSILIEIDKTGNLTNQQLIDLGNNAFDSASKWGALVQDYLSSSETFAQAGVSNLEEMSDLSTMAQMAGQMTAETATNFLISSDAAWQMKGNVEQLTSVLDGMNSITNKNALEMTDLANGIRVAGSMLANSGLAEDQAAALIGTGVATTKSSGEEVARGVRTIIMNLRQIKGETEDGELIDDESLKKVEQTCKDVGVSLKTVKNGVVELRNPIDILRELSEVYNSLDTMDARRAQITDDIAGKHRSNILSSILTNFDQYDKMLQDYASGEGSAFEEAMKTSESWEGRLNSLKNQWTEFVDGFVNADMMTAGISGLENMVVAMDKLNDAQLFIPAMLSAFTGLRNLFTGKGLTDISISQDGTGSLGKLDLQGNLFGIDFTKMGEWKSHFAEAESLLKEWNKQCLIGQTSVEDFGGEFVKQNKSFRDFISTAQDGNASLENYKKYLKETGEYQNNFSNSLKSAFTNAAVGFIAGVGIELAVAGVTKLYDYIVHADDRVREAAETARSEWESAQSDIESTNSELETTQQRINELKAKGSLSLVEEQELADLQKQNEELERTLKIQQDIENVKHSEAKSTAKDSLETKKKYEFNTDSFGNFISTKEKRTSTDAINRYIDEIHVLEEAKEELYKEIEKLDVNDESYEFDLQSLEGQIENFDIAINGDKEALAEAYDEVSTNISLFVDETTGKVESGMEEQYEAFLEAQKRYDALLGNTAQTKESAINTLFAKKQFSGLEDSFMEAAKTGEDAISSLISATPGLSDALDNAGVSVDEFIAHFMALGNPDTYNFNEIKRQLKEGFAGVLEDDATAGDYKNYNDRARQFNKFLEGKSDEEIEIFYKYVNSDGIDLSQLTLEDIQELFIKVTADTEEAETSMDELAESANTLLSSISSVNSALASQTTGESISPDIFSDEGLQDYASALEYVNGCYKLNEDKVKELTKAKVDEQIATNNTSKALQQQDYLKNAAEIDTLRQKLEDSNFAQGESAESIQAQIDNLLESNSAIISNCNQLDVLNASLRESIGVYQQWKDAQSAGNSGDMFDDAGTAWSQIREIADKDSDMYGRVGTVQYQAAVDFLVPENIDHSDGKAVQKYLDSIKKYMYFDKNGDVNGLNMDTFLNDAVKKGLMTETEDSYQLVGQMTMEKFAEGMGLALPLVQAMFGEIEEFKPEGETWFDWSDELYTSFGDGIIACEQSAAELEAEIDSLTRQRDEGIEIDDSHLEELQQKLDEVNQKKQELEESSIANIEANIDIDQQIETAKAELEGWKTSLEADPTNVEVQANVESAEANLQELEDKKSQLQTPTSVEIQAATQSIDSQIASIQQQIENLGNKEYTAKFNISDENASAKISELQGQLSTLEEQKKNIQVYAETSGAQADVDKIDSTDIADKKFTVSAIDRATSVLNAINNTKLSNKSFTITENHVTTSSTSSSKSSKSSKVNGTAHAYGTALANGAWGAKQGGMTLVGELGREIVVNPYTGKWHTVGDNGPEFTNIPEGAIVFNHLQTEELLKNGYVTSRAQALVSGTAFAFGNAMVTGGVPKTVTTIRNNNQKTTEKSSFTNKNTTATNKNTSATNSNTDAIEDAKDYIAIKLERLSHSLDEFTTLASDYYTGYIKQNEQLNKAISQAKTNINENSAAYWHYMNKADSVGLSEDYKNRIKNGEFNIENITDENLKDQIEEFQQWYEAAQSCRDTIIELNAELKELGIQKIDNIVDDFDSIVGVTESIYGNYEAANQLLEAQGKSASVQNLQVMASQKNNAADWRRGELQRLRQEEQELVSSGVIAKWSQEWYELEGQIHDVQAEINSTVAEIYELRQQIREVNWKGFTDGIEAIDALNDNLENTLSLIDDMESFAQDDSLLNSNGILKLGLYGKQLGNARQAVADYEYAIEILNKELKIGNVTQEQYDEQLKELNEGRWEAVSSVKQYRDAILDLVRDGIDKETEAMQKLVDTRKDDLQAQKDADDYAKTLREKNQSINKIKAQIAALEGDDSASAKAQIRNLQNQLKEAEQDLQDTKDEHTFDLLQDGYDSAMEKFEQIQEDELYLLNSSLEAQNQAIQDMLAVARDSYQVVYDELGSIAETYGTKLSDDLTNPWKSAQNAVASYKQAVEELQANVTISTSGVTSVSNNSSDVYFAESSSSVPDNNVQQNYEAQKAAQAAQVAQTQQSSMSGYVSGISETLQYGSRGDNVRKLQNVLNALGYNAGSVDGIFGANTQAAVKRFQSASGIAVDGVVGVNTKAKFRAKGYAKGALKTIKGIALTDEEGLGTEAIITNQGTLRQLDYGDTVFNNNQVHRLWDLSNGEFPYDLFTNAVTLPDYSSQISNMIQPKNIGTTVHFDNLLNVEGNLTEDILPKVQTMISSAISDFDNEQRRKIANDFRKTGGRIIR